MVQSNFVLGCHNILYSKEGYRTKMNHFEVVNFWKGLKKPKIKSDMFCGTGTPCIKSTENGENAKMLYGQTDLHDFVINLNVVWCRGQLWQLSLGWDHRLLSKSILSYT